MAVSEAITEISFFLIKFTSHSCCHLLPNTYLLKQPYAVIGSFSETANRILNHPMTFFSINQKQSWLKHLKDMYVGIKAVLKWSPCDS